jgi:membrane protein YqaA with SNARE-associated domain
MKKRNFLFWIIFGAVVISFLLVVFLNLDFFRRFIAEKINSFGYVAIFIFTLIVDLVQQPFGPETPVLISFFLGFNILGIFFMALLGSYCGGLLGFYFGKLELSKRIEETYKKEKYQKYRKFFKKWGKSGLVIAALTPFPYPFFCWFAGAFNLSLREFFIYALIPRTFRIGLPLLIFWLIFNL